MRTANRTKILSLFGLIAGSVYGQAAGSGPAAPGPDVLTFKDGEKLIGHLVSSKGDSVVFKSDAAGSVTVEWSKVQELRSAAKFAAIPPGVRLRGAKDQAKIPQGTVAMTDQKVEVAPAPPASPQTIPVTNVAQLVDEATFQKAFERQNFLQGWAGGVTAGVSLTESTQKSTNVSAAVNLVRSVPGEDWADLRSRTILGFTDAYGKVSEAGTPSVKTSVYHASAEQDWYLKPRLFAFVTAIFDHSFSQGLDLQQNYGGGLGFVVFKNDKQEFDVKASVNYINQQFNMSSLNNSLIGSVFGESYLYKFPHGIVFDEQGGYTPAWNNSHAYSAFPNAALTFPVYHRFGLTLAGVENFINNPPPGFKKNSFQFTGGVTYSLQ